uniref:Uncharacterized protein n=1 Tax=Tetradesmus obliquus TaxID=3088 RepID=A0A383WE89_TETOB
MWSKRSGGSSPAYDYIYMCIQQAATRDSCRRKRSTAAAVYTAAATAAAGEAASAVGCCSQQRVVRCLCVARAPGIGHLAATAAAAAALIKQKQQ